MRARDRRETGNFFVIESPDWVNIIALTPEKEVVLIEQFRYGTEEIILEIPGGMIDGSESAETRGKTGTARGDWLLGRKVGVSWNIAAESRHSKQ